MGKKKDKEKKIKGAEKTRMKTEKNLEKKCKKMMKETGEKDIEEMIADCKEQSKKRQQVIEEKCAQPSPRCNMSLSTHPDKDQLIMFGGEYFNGRKTEIYDDLFLYNIKSGEWSQIKCPNGPSPRCSHQAVVLPHRGGELWVFGGEFPSPSQSQYHHFRDLWLLQLKDMQWRQVTGAGGPSARSGHRMVAMKKLLVVFGGYHDNLKGVYQYYNDVHVFNTETFVWMKVEIQGVPPSPRSGCVIASTDDQSRVVVYGGYSKEKMKKDSDKGNIHTDMFMLQGVTKDGGDESVVRLKWQPVKQSGCKPSPRCSCSMIVTGGNRAFFFGGVYDEEDEESIEGKFYNDMYTLDIDKGRWNQLVLRSVQSTSNAATKRRRKVKPSAAAGTSDEAKQDGGCDDDNHDDADDDDEMEEPSGLDQEVEQLKVNQVTTLDDGIFTVKVGGSSVLGAEAACKESGSEAGVGFVPRGRMNAQLAVKKGQLYLYGGLYEDGDKQITLSDLYQLDLHRLQQWKTIVPLDISKMEWQESDDEESDDDDDDDDDDDEMETDSEDDD